MAYKLSHYCVLLQRKIAHNVKVLNGISAKIEKQRARLMVESGSE
jgi:hypothetical protein